MRSIIIIVLIAFLLCTSFNGIASLPEDIQVISEFASESTSGLSDRIPYVSFSSDLFQIPSSGNSHSEQLIFNGRLPNGLGSTQIFNSGQGFYHAFGNLEDETHIFLVMDTVHKRIVNPEIFFESSIHNRKEQLLSLRFEYISTENGSEPNNEGGQNQNRSNEFPAVSQRETIILFEALVNGRRISSQRSSIETGLYTVEIHRLDSQFNREDLRGIFSIRLFLNSELQIWNGSEYFQENDTGLQIFPIDELPVQMNIPVGENFMEIEIHNSRGVSTRYEYVIEGVEGESAE